MTETGSIRREPHYRAQLISGFGRSFHTFFSHRPRLITKISISPGPAMTAVLVGEHPRDARSLTRLGATEPPQDLVPSAGVVVSTERDQRLEIFSLGQDKSIYRIFQTPDGSWSSWFPLLGHDILQIIAARNADGRLELFALGSDHWIDHRWQEVPNGAWRDWFILG